MQRSQYFCNNLTLSDSDTDDEEEMISSDNSAAHREDRKLDELRGSRTAKAKYNRSRHATSNQQNTTYDPYNNYLKEEIGPNKLLCQLSSHAFDIVGSEPNAQTQKSTVCLCVALRDKNEYIKQFVFHNGGNVMSPSMRKKAQELGYDVIKAERSHAELQFLQFLVRREQIRPGLYTHIMGMGCSRCYCSECNHILQGLVSKNYLKIATSVYHKKDGSVGPKPGPVSAVSKPVNALDKSGIIECTQSVAQDVAYKMAKDEKTVDDAIYEHCYVPLGLQSTFNEASGMLHDFSNKRLTESKQNKSSRRRKK